MSCGIVDVDEEGTWTKDGDWCVSQEIGATLTLRFSAEAAMVHGAVLKDEGVRFSCTLNGDQAQTWFEADAPDSDDTSLRLCIIGQLDSTVTHTLAITNQGGTLAVASFERVMSSTNLSNDEFDSDLDDAAVQSPSEVSTSTNSSTSSTTATPTDDATPTSTQLAEPAKTGEPVITASNIDAGDAGSDGDLPAASQTTGTVEIPSEPTTGGSSSSSSMIAVFVVIAFLVVIGVVGGVVAWKKKRRGTGKGGNKGRYTVIHVDGGDDDYDESSSEHKAHSLGKPRSRRCEARDEVASYVRRGDGAAKAGGRRDRTANV